jgi:hypothetical protein
VQLLQRDIPLPLILTGLALSRRHRGNQLAARRLLPASLIAAIFTLSLAGNMPIWEPLLIYALGTLWYGVFNWFWFWLWREQPLRESLSLLYRELANYCEAKYSLLTQHTDPPHRCRRCSPPAEGGGSDYPVLSADAYAGANQRNDHKRLLRAFQVGWIFRNIFPSACISRKRCKTGGAQPRRSGDPLERANRCRPPAGAGG